MMKLAAALPATAAPAMPPVADTAPVDATPVRRAPSTLTAPAIDDGSAAASASLDQVASYVGMLHAALTDDPTFYARLVKRGFLESAIEYAKYAYTLVDYDKAVNNDGLKGMIDGAVLEALLAAKGMGLPTIAEPNLSSELAMARAAATNAARGLETLAVAPA